MQRDLEHSRIGSRVASRSGLRFVPSVVELQGGDDPADKDQQRSGGSKLVIQCSGANGLIKQRARLSDPVLTINAAVKPLQTLGNAVDVVFTHIGNLLKVEDSDFV